MLTDYQEVYQGEIFVKSQCIELENSLMDFFQRNLLMLNYQSVNNSKKIWRRDNKTVVVCLVDDISTCSDNESNVSALFDSDTIVITDNKINVDTDYRVLKLPDSFFGIYYYKPENIKWNPVNDINLSINRIDPIRQLILMELVSCNHVDNVFKNLNINFNCFMHQQGTDQASLINNFKWVWSLNSDFFGAQQKYNQHYLCLLDHIPIKNHNLTVESSMLGSFVNMIVETYSRNDIVAISEKTFRSLVYPVPWTIFSGSHTADFLKFLGFDLLDDLVDHTYNNTVYESYSLDRIVDYVSQSIKLSNDLKQMSKEHLISRCNNAAANNQDLLKRMRYQWPQDFAQWWHCNMQYVA